MLKKSFAFEFSTNADERTFEGYASTWKRDLVGDQIHQGAFAKTIRERFPRNQIKVLWQHDQPIGIPIRMEEDSKGLFVVGKVSKTRLGDEALELMRDGVIDSMSIGYDVMKDALSQDGQTRELHELKLYEFSPVTFPANPDTVITGVKSTDYDATELLKLLTELNGLLKAANFEPQHGTSGSHSKPLEGTQINDMFAILEQMKNYKILGG